MNVRNKIVKLLRPNPNWEEDIAWATEMTQEHIDRVKSYPIKAQKRSRDCSCKELGISGAAPLIKLNNGKFMPGLGLGTWLGMGIKAPTDNSVQQAVDWAIDAGYRHIDTAAIYGTEPLVGQAIQNKIEDGTVRRDELFVTTKLWNDSHRPEAVVPALKKSLEQLNMTYVDMYLIHWPTGQFADGTYDLTDYVDTWKSMIEAKGRGLTRSIGVSNFNLQQMDRLVSSTKEKPSCLQIELNLNLQQPELLKFCCENDIQVVAYTPFGSIFANKASSDAPPPRTSDPELLKIADKYKKTVSQIVLRYLVELGTVPIPKSVTKERIEQNIDIFDFSLTLDEKKFLKSFDYGYRTIAPEPFKGSPYYPFEDNPKIKISKYQL